MIQSTTESGLDRVLAPVADCLTPEVARKIIDARVDRGLQARLDELARKANSGTLTEIERAEYEEYIDGLDLLAILKAKAGLFLAEQRNP